MTRLFPWLIALLVFSGCRGSGASGLMDPFSRTKIEPPRTGCIIGQPADPYYSRTRQAALPDGTSSPSGSGLRTGPQTTASATGPRSPYQPAGGYGYRKASAEQTGTLPVRRAGDRVAIPLAARNPSERSGNWANQEGLGAGAGPSADKVDVPSSPVAATSSAVASAGARPLYPQGSAGDRPADGTGDALAAGERVVGTIQPMPAPPAGSANTRSPVGTVTSVRSEPRRLVVPQEAIDIMDLPPAGSAAGVKTSRGGRSGTIRLVSATQQLSEASDGASPVSGTLATTLGGIKTASYASRARYGYDPQYRWLRGRLEYSEVDHRWKLRYIPIDGTTDQYGGSVVLSNVSLLSGYERGQFVEVHGVLGPAPQNEDDGYAPQFEIQQIQRLAS